MRADRPPLVLLHGVTNSAHIWDDVAPLLAGDFELVVPTAAGHRGGPPKRGHVTIANLVDGLETVLDQRGIAAAHVAGNSLGGWMAVELARRGRALSVCALSPAGCWPETRDKAGTSAIRRGRQLARVGAPIAPVAMRSAALRRFLLRDAAEHGDRLTPGQAVGFTRDIAACDAAPDVLATTERMLPLDPLPCPVTVAWAARDRILPARVHAVTARTLLPTATHLELPGVGHVPMIDDPVLCADVIRSAALSTD